MCGHPILSYKESNVDHILPRSKGGTNTLKNLQIVHSSCNSQKGSKMTKQCKRAALEVYPNLFDRISKIKEVVIEFNGSHGVDYVNSKKRKALQARVSRGRYSRVVTSTYQPSTAPMDLFNEFSKNGMKNLSYNRILEYFEEYKNHQPYKVEVK